MKINKENYQAYFLDYYEGRLSEADEAGLFVFLGMHPELKEEFEAFDPVSLPSDGNIAFTGKGSLKRGVITPDNYDWYFAAYAEGDLSAGEREAVEAFASADEAMAKELVLMQKAFLPAGTVEFPGKASLKRHYIAPATLTSQSQAAGHAVSSGNDETSAISIAFLAGIRKVVPYASVAAVIMLFAGLFFLRNSGQESHDLAHDIPAAWSMDEPVAVAEVPSLQQDLSSEAGISPAAKPDRFDGTAASAQTVQPQSDQPQTNGSYHTTAPQTVIQYAGILSLPGINRSITSSGLPVARPVPVNIDHRSEFAYWSPDVLAGVDAAATAEDQSGSETTLSRLAMGRLQKTLPIDFSKADEHIRENRFPLWAIAGAGLTSLGSMASNALGIERETDSEGRTVAISAGNSFEARRK